MRYKSLIALLFISMLKLSAQHTAPAFSYLDVYELEYASDPQIAPYGDYIVYRRMGFDILKDQSIGNLWLLKTDGSIHQKLTNREVSESSPIWSPKGDRIAFISPTDQGSEIYLYWVDSGKLARISRLEGSPSSITWSPDGTKLAFTMKIAQAPPVIAKMPAKPKGAQWADVPRITDRLKHEADGSGYITPGYTHIFTLPADGGSPRQLTSGDFNHGGNLSWSSDGNYIYFSANRSKDWEYDYINSEVYRVHTNSGQIETLTSQKGPDYNPQIAPNGKIVAYLSYEDKVQAHQIAHLHFMNPDGTNSRAISVNFDREMSNLIWDPKSTGLYFSYDEFGNTKIGHITIDGKITKLADNIGGTSIGRPYPSGSFSVSQNGMIVFTHTTPSRPADIAVISGKNSEPKLLTQLNEDLLASRTLGKVEEMWYTSSVDGRKLQGWIVYPPNYDATKKYPMMVENHGGPILNYGDRFSAEMQLYATGGYIVFYPNPRGSTSYGEAFANLLYNNYPGEDYNDVMDGVDQLIKKGIAHEDALYVTGGSAGGIMTAWIIGKNNRFEAAVVAKPVINWISKTLVADNYYGYANYRMPGQPWENVEGYWNFSPISLVANMETPAMIIVGMDDLRTPPSEAKQLYHALKLRKKETVLVEIPGASHDIARRPSNMITQVSHTLAWFDKYRITEK